MKSLKGVHASSHFSEDDMLTIEMRELVKANEELTSVGAWTSVGHRQNSCTSMLVLEVLVSEFGSIDGLTTSSVALGEVASLSHEVLDHSVELAALVVEGLA